MRAEKEKEKGTNAIKNKNFREAVMYYREAISFNPSDPTIYYNRALAYIRLNECMNAVHDCNKAIELNKQYFKCYERRALAYFQLKEFEKAVNDAIFVLQTEPNSMEMRRLLNDANKNIIEQRKPIKFNVQTDSDDDEEEFIDEEIIFYDSIEYVERNIRLLEKNSNYVEDFMMKGEYSSVIEGSIENLHIISQIITKKNNKIENRRYFFAKSFIKSQIILMQFDQALVLIEQFKSFESETIKNYKFSVLEAFIYELQGNYEESLKVLENSNKSRILITSTISKLKQILNPDTSKPMISTLKLQHHLKNWNYSNDKAKNFFKENKFETSIQEFDKIFKTIVHEFSYSEIISEAELKQLVINILNNKAIAHSKIKNFHESNKICLKVLKFERNQPKACYWLGKNLLELKFYKQAKEWLNASLATNPDNKAAVCELQKIDEFLLKLNGDPEVIGKIESSSQGLDEINEETRERKVENEVNEERGESKVENEVIDLENIKMHEEKDSSEEQVNEKDEKFCVDEELDDEFKDIDIEGDSEENDEIAEIPESLNPSSNVLNQEPDLINTISIEPNQEPDLLNTSSIVPNQEPEPLKTISFIPNQEPESLNPSSILPNQEPELLNPIPVVSNQEPLTASSSSAVQLTNSSIQASKPLNLSLAKQYAESESFPIQLTGKALVASLDQIIKSRTLLSSIKVKFI